MIREHSEKMRCKPAEFDDKITCHLRNSNIKAVIELAIVPALGYKSISDWLYDIMMNDILPREFEKIGIPFDKYVKKPTEKPVKNNKKIKE